MVSFTFEGLFITTYKGIPDTTSLPASTTMAHSHYLYSSLIQATLLIFFVLYFILSIYRVIKKIKNKNFREVPDEQKKQQNQCGKNDNDPKNEQEVQDVNKQKEKEENLIYRFDQQDDQEQQKKEENHEVQDKQKDADDMKKEDEENNQQNADDEFNDYHDANEQPFIDLDEKLLYLQPFLISFIVANNLFEADALILVSLILMFISYFFINIKGFLSHLRLAPMIFVIFALFPYISFFKGDHDVST